MSLADCRLLQRTSLTTRNLAVGQHLRIDLIYNFNLTTKAFAY